MTQNLGKPMLPEYLDYYYSTAMLWLRILSLKQKNSRPHSDAELDNTTISYVPEPVSFCTARATR